MENISTYRPDFESMENNGQSLTVTLFITQHLIWNIKLMDLSWDFTGDATNPTILLLVGTFTWILLLFDDLC